ncbi:GGDEF domain-containing protein [Marinobacter nauticus]|uniref:GGDEF domain-containing protein n=1 Tax=Marinobacter nauticus TaxID=2743 RepID=UPI001C94DD0C|nr:GGDEF domain-containing protein [Marinobacter nauticus]MBY6220210.1 GGDEF domain-containing protein [Marinobacter nauticus]
MDAAKNSIPQKWHPAFEAYKERMESGLQYGGAMLLLVTVSLYHLSHTYFHVHQANLGTTELLLRLPLVGATFLALIAHWTGYPRWPARYFLRLMGITLSGLALALLYLFTLYEPIMVTQVSDAMTIAFFGATVMALRSLREWILIVLIPVSVFWLAAIIKGLPLVTLVAVFIGPALIMFVTCMLMAFVRKVAVDGFISREKLHEIATTDPLTGLLNRRAFMPLVRQEYARATRSDSVFSVILADLDKFKKVNDTWGHEAGDLVLLETATRLGSCLRQQDALCRWGGEEFLILLPDTDAEGAMIVAEKCRRQMADRAIDIHGVDHTQTLSLGAAEHRTSEGIDPLIIRADEALYWAKEHGRNRAHLSGSN